MQYQNQQLTAVQRFSEGNTYSRQHTPFIAQHTIRHFFKRVNRSLSYLLKNEKSFLFKNETTQLVYPSSESSYKLKIYTGLSVTPDDVAELVQPRAGEMLCVLYRANRILAYARASVKSSFSKSGGINVRIKSGEVHISELKFLVNEQFENMLAVFLSAISRKLHFMGFSSVYIACRDQHHYGIRNIVKAGFELKTITSKYHMFGSEIAKTVQTVHYQDKQLTSPKTTLRKLPAPALLEHHERPVITSIG